MCVIVLVSALGWTFFKEETKFVACGPGVCWGAGGGYLASITNENRYFRMVLADMAETRNFVLQGSGCNESQVDHT